jgi:hypothetical protein
MTLTLKGELLVTGDTGRMKIKKEIVVNRVIN